MHYRKKSSYCTGIVLDAELDGELDGELDAFSSLVFLSTISVTLAVTNNNNYFFV